MDDSESQCDRTAVSPLVDDSEPQCDKAAVNPLVDASELQCDQVAVNPLVVDLGLFIKNRYKMQETVWIEIT